ncbi:uncharacterized protein [Palaemon carinicauda]|uniref:uncharacterized protein isoform X2 n=1 Tax=Palaemon carinicauda TaxID=392227 RepID=UPI0035B67886
MFGMDRRDSFASCKSDSEYDGDSDAGSYSNLTTGERQSRGDRSRLSQSSADSPSGVGRTPRRPTTPLGKDFRRPGVKRQAPQPPAVSTANLNQSASPVTTVHLQFEPVMSPPVNSSNNPFPEEQTRKITKIISESIAMDPILAASSASTQLSNSGPIEYHEVMRQPAPLSQSLPSNQILVVDSQSFYQNHAPEVPLSRPSHMIPIQRAARYQQFAGPTPGLVDPSILKDSSVTLPQQGVSGPPMEYNRPLSPNRHMSPSRPMSPPSRPMSPPRATHVSRGGRVTGPQPGRVLSPARKQQGLPSQPHDFHHVMTSRGELVSLPTQGLPQAHVLPQTPNRTASSQVAAKNIGNLRIRLIDEESDSEAYQSDATEDIRELHGERSLLPRTSIGSGSYPTNQVPRNDSKTYFPENMTNSQESFDYFSSFDESSFSELGSEPSAEVQPTVVMRGRARRLAHSASDPGVTRPQRLTYLQEHPRPPGVAVPPPLDQLSEEDVTQAEYEERKQEHRVKPGIQRSDSMVTVAHLYEDVLVSSRLRIRVTLTNLTVVVVVAALVLPNTAITLYTAFRLVFGTLFPAYYSYKAVKTKNVKEYVKWMMYWIVFAFFTCFETITDLFLSFWFPFYYELKILVVLWLLSPATRGSSILYRKFVHPWLTRREDDIDNCIAQAKQQGYSTVIQLGTKGVNYATTVLMQTAIKGSGSLVNQLRRSYSSGELSDGDMNRNVKALPHIPDDNYDDHPHSSGPYDAETRVRAESDAAYRSRGSSVNRGIRSNKTRSADVTDYYQDSDEAVQRRRSPRTQDTASRVLSADDLTSGYSSGDPDAGDLIYDLRHDTVPNNPELIIEPKRATKVRRTQSLSASTLSNHRAHRVLSRRGEGLRSGSAGRGSGPVDDSVIRASYSSSGHPAASHQGSTFKRSRPGEISAYATLPRTGNKRTAAKKRQV